LKLVTWALPHFDPNMPFKNSSFDSSIRRERLPAALFVASKSFIFVITIISSSNAVSPQPESKEVGGVLLFGGLDSGVGFLLWKQAEELKDSPCLPFQKTTAQRSRNRGWKLSRRNLVFQGLIISDQSNFRQIERRYDLGWISLQLSERELNSAFPGAFRGSSPEAGGGLGVDVRHGKPPVFSDRTAYTPTHTAPDKGLCPSVAGQQYVRRS
jgi:hypothetical protein